MNILAYDPYPDRRFAEEAGITYTTLNDLYARSDIISLHCPPYSGNGTPDQYGFHRKNEGWSDDHQHGTRQAD